MKKTLLIAISILLCMQLFAAPSLASSYSRGVVVNGFVKSYCIVNIKPITATSKTASFGVPFNIMGEDIKFKGDFKLGREIARCDIATNLDNVTLTFNITPLTHEGDGTQISYYLTFRIAYDGMQGGTFGSIVDYYSIPSDGLDHIITITNRDGEDVLPVISLDQDIRFVLAQNYDSVSASWPGGDYYSNVTLLLEAN